MKYMLLRLINIFILIIIVTEALLHEHNLLKIMMRYNLLNLAAFRELPKILKKLDSIHDNYEYFTTASINVIVDLTITLLNIAADVILPNGELIGAGDYACRRGIKHSLNRGVNCAELLDFIIIAEDIREKITHIHQDLLENK